MRIIDDKGRLFGMINVIDFIAILFFVMLILLGYLGYKLTSRDTNPNSRLVGIQVNFTEVMPELARTIKPGDVERGYSGKVIGKITEIIETGPSSVVLLRLNNQLVTTVSNVKKDISAGLNITCRESDDTFYYKDQPVKIGKEFTFSTNLYSITGTVADIQPDRDLMTRKND